MTLEEILSIISTALSEKFPKAEIVTYDEPSSPYITVIHDDVTFDVAVSLGEEYSG